MQDIGNDGAPIQLRIGNESRRPCVDRVPGHMVLLAAVTAAPDRRIATPVDGLSAVRLPATPGSSRPSLLVLAVASLVKVAGGPRPRKARYRDRMAAQAIPRPLDAHQWQRHAGQATDQPRRA